jgi:hypothetical protein
MTSEKAVTVIFFTSAQRGPLSVAAAMVRDGTKQTYKKKRNRGLAGMWCCGL